MLIRLHTTAQAVIHEEWLIDVPDVLAEDVLREPNNVLAYIAVDADIAVHPVVEERIVEVSGRTFDSAVPGEPAAEYVGKHRDDAA